MHSHRAITLDQQTWVSVLRGLWLALLFSDSKLHSEGSVGVSCVASCLPTNTPYEFVLELILSSASVLTVGGFKFDTEFLTLREEKQERIGWFWPPMRTTYIVILLMSRSLKENSRVLYSSTPGATWVRDESMPVNHWGSRFWNRGSKLICCALSSSATAWATTFLFGFCCSREILSTFHLPYGSLRKKGSLLMTLQNMAYLSESERASAGSHKYKPKIWVAMADTTLTKKTNQNLNHPFIKG